MSSPSSSELQREGSVVGVVVEALPNTTFRVEYTTVDGQTRALIAYLAGKMRLHRIKVVVGDNVDVLLDGYSGTKGRITRRLDTRRAEPQPQ